jgi:hypothetical protein
LLDPRLLPLIDTLVRADLDWLAQEIVSGALAGHVPEEPVDALLAARSIVFRAKQDAGVREVAPPVEAAAEPFDADEQIAWAASHVGDRLDQLLEMMSLSLERIDAIVVSAEGERALSREIGETTLVLEDGDASTKVDLRQVAAARDGVGQLRAALETWSASVRRAGEPA